MKQSTAFYVLTDTHLMSPENWVEGMPITRREHGDQIALKATPQILDAFLQIILADTQTDTVLFTGDNVDDGDMQSHFEFRQRLEKLTAAGKKVYVTSATHDYCGDGEDENRFHHAKRFTSSGTEPIPFMHRKDLFDFYYDYGPRQAISVHRESGSYIVQLGDGVRLAAIVDNGNGRSHCGLFEDGIQWLTQQIRDAKAAGDVVLLAVHHPVLPPWETYRHIAEFEMYGGYRQLWDLLCEENVRAVFTGHTHVQNIRKYTDDNGRWFLDISTIALANAAGKMRRVTVDAQTLVCDVQSVGITSLSGLDTGGLSAYDYLYPQHSPGILERLLPLGAEDFPAFLALADGLLDVEKLRKHRHLVRFVCRRLRRMRLSTAAKLGGTWRALTDEQKRYTKTVLTVDACFAVLRHIFPGNAPFPPETAENRIATGLARRLDQTAKLFRIRTLLRLIPPGSSFAEMLQDLLYNNRTGDDDAIRFPLRDQNDIG